MSTAANQLVATAAPLDWRRPWLALLLLWGILYVAAEMNVRFTTTEAYNVIDDQMSDADRAEYNADAAEQGSVARRVGLLALAAFGAVCLVVPAPRRVRVQGLTGVLVLLFLGWALASVAWSSEPVTTLRKLTALGSLALGALGVARCFSLRTIVQFTILAAGGLFLAGVISELALGTFQPWNPAYRFSGLTWPAFSAWTLSLLILAAATIYPTLAKHRGALLLLGTAALAGLLLTRTRAGTAGLAAGLGAYAVLTWPVRRTVMAGLALVAVTAACLLTLELTVGNVGERVNDAINLGRAESAEGVSGRWDLWQDLIPFVSARPVTGYGYDSFWTPDRLVQIGSDNWGAPDAHNGYLNLTLGVGLIGAAAYALVLLAGMGRACHRYRATGNVEFAFACCAILVLAINTGFVSTQLSPALYSFITLVLLAHLGFIDDPTVGRISAA